MIGERQRQIMETAGPTKGPIVMDWDVLKEVEEKLRQQPDNAILWAARGVLYFHEDFEVAIESFSQALSIDPFNSNIYYNRGRKFLSQDRFPQALADFTLATRLDDKDSWKWHFKGVALFSLQRYEEAVDCFKKSIEWHENNGSNNTPPEVEWIWMAYIKMGEPQKAAEILELIDADTPCEPGDMSYKKRILLNKGVMTPEEYEANVDYTKDAGAITELYGLANYYYHQKHDVEKAITYLEKVLAFETSRHAFAYKQAMEDIEQYKKELGA